MSTYPGQLAAAGSCVGLRVQNATPAVQIQTLRLGNLRRHATATFELSPGINAWVGPNGSGKTTVLEALHLLALTKGFRPDKELILHGADHFTVEALLAQAPHQRWHIGFVPTRGKRFLYDHTPLPRLSDHIGALPIVAVLPDDTRLLEGGGTERRSWLNSLLAQSDRGYLTALLAYDRALQQRNALLQQAQAGQALSEALLAPFDAVLLRTTPVLWQARRGFFESFAPLFEAVYQALLPAPAAEQPTLAWKNPLATPSELAALLQRARPADLAAGRTTVGLHREDLELLLDGVPVRHYGSQGQRKTFLLALKLAQYQWLHRTTGKAPLLLLDDVCDRLDAQRTEALFHTLHTTVAGQIAVTDTSQARIEAALAAGGIASAHLNTLSL